MTWWLWSACSAKQRWQPVCRRMSLGQVPLRSRPPAPRLRKRLSLQGSHLLRYRLLRRHPNPNHNLEVNMLKTLLKRGTDPVAEDASLGVVVAAPPNVFQPFLALGAEGANHVNILATTRDASDLLGDVQSYRPQIVLLSPEVRGYSSEVVAQLASWPEFPIAVIGLVPENGNWGAAMSASGAPAFYTLPVTLAIVNQFDRQARLLFEQACQHWNAPVAAAGVPRQVVEAVGATGHAYRTGV